MYLGCFIYTIICMHKWVLLILSHDNTQLGEVADENDYIREYLDSYLKKDKPGFAVFLNGPWGSGKTYFINEYKTKIRKKIYVSLFGISNKKEFEFRLWKGMIFDSSNIILKTIIPYIFIVLFFIFCLWYFKDNIFNFLVAIHPYYGSFIFALCKEIIIICTSPIGALSVISAIVLYIWKYIRFKAMDRLLKKCFLVLDDFERVEVSCNEVLSWINEFVEHVNVPIVIIGNEKAIYDNIELKYDEEKVDGEKNHYEKIKEKTIGKEFNFEQTDEKVCRKLIENLDSSSDLKRTLEKENNLEWFIKVVLNPLKNEPYKHQTNYRVLASCFSEFDFNFNKNIFLDSDKKTWAKFVSEKKYENYWKELIVRFISFMYLKKIQCIPVMKNEISSSSSKNYTDYVDLVYSDAFVDNICDIYLEFNDDKVVKEFSELYPNWKKYYPYIDATTIFKEIDKSKSISGQCYWLVDQVVNNDSDPTILEKWEDVFNLDDNDYKALLIDTEEEFKTPTIHTLSNLIYLIKLIFEIYIDGKIKRWNKIQLKNLLEVYIDKIFTDKIFKLNLQNSFSYEGAKKTVEKAFPTQGDDKSLIQIIKNKILDEINISFKEKSTRLYKSIVNKINLDSNKFENWYNEGSEIDEDYFYSQNPEELLNALRYVKTRDFIKILDCFSSHINEHLKISEIPFWKEFINLANKDLVVWKSKNINIWKSDYLETFCKEVKEKLVEYEALAKLHLKKENDPNSEETD